MPEALVFRLLGGLAVSQGDHPVSGFHSHKEQALLCYLAATARPHTRPYLAGLFWGDRPEPRALANLRRALTHLRAVAVDHLLITRQTVAFDCESDYWLDVEVFQAQVDKYTGEQVGRDPSAHPLSTRILKLREAVDIYQGDFLEGFYVKGCPAFEEWVVVERERLQGLAVEALRTLAGLHQSRGEYPIAIECARRLLALDPWLEEAHRTLMHLLALNSQREQALAQYETCRRLLAEELGLEPLEETAALYDKLVDWETGKWATQPAGLPIDQLADLPFVGRGEEHAALVGRWEAARQGEGKLALVEGEAGVGKTRLVEEIAHYAETQGAAVLRGRCYEFGGGMPYQPIASALRGEILGFKSQLLNLSDVWLAELARLLPEVHHVRPDLPKPVQDAGEVARQRLFEAVSRLLVAFESERGALLLFLDDLHWADQSTLDLLHYLVRRPSGASIWIAGAYRPEELSLGHPLTRLRQGLSRDHLVERLILEPLPKKAVEEIAHSLVGEEEGAAFGAFLYYESEGNPFILVETVNDLRDKGALRGEEGEHWRWDGPPATKMLPVSVQDVILQRVGRLGEPAQNLLLAAATIGRQFDAPLLQAATGQGVGVVEEGLRDWLARRLVKLYPSLDVQYDFSHDKIRAVVYQAAGPTRRRTLHRQVAEALEHLHAERIEEHAGPLAHHWGQVGDTERERRYCWMAGEQAAAVFANAEAVTYLSRALDLTPEDSLVERCNLLLAREKVYDLLGDRPSQRQDIETLGLLAETLNDDQRRANVALRRAKYAEATTDFPASVAAAQAVTNLARGGETPTPTGEFVQLEIEGYLAWSAGLWRLGEYEAARSQLAHALELARAARLRPLEADSLYHLGIISHRQSEYADARVHLNQALAIYRETGNQEGELKTLNILGFGFLLQGNLARGVECCEQALSIARETGNRRGEAMILGNLGGAAFAQGDCAKAITIHKQALRIYREIGDRWGEGMVLSNLGVDHAYVGNYDATKDYYEQGLRIDRESGDKQSEALTICNFSITVHRQDDDKAAREYAQQALRIAQEFDEPSIYGHAWTHLGHALIGLGFFNEAAAAYQQGLDTWRKLGQHHLAVESQAGLAQASLLQGDLSQARTHIEEVLNYFEHPTLESMDDTFFETYWSCYKTLQACQDPRSQDILTTAYHLLQERAAKISDEEMQRSFLENVAAHKEIVREWTKANQR